MTLRLSEHKVSLLLYHLFAGRPQEAVAAKVGASQSSVSLWFSRLKFRAGKIGLLEAGKEFGIMHQLESLRSLAVELFKNHLTVQDARQGLSIIRAFLALGVPPAQHKDLVRVCKKVAEPGFIAAALELCRVEAKAGITYQQVVAQFNEMGSKVQHLASEAAEQSSQLSGLKDQVAGRKAELAGLDAQYAHHSKEVADKEKKLEDGLKKKMESVKVTTQDVEMLFTLKTYLAKKGLGLGALVTLATEFKNGK
jgi:hypothetical protein